MGRAKQALLGRRHQEALQPELGLEIDRRRISADEVADLGPVGRAAQDAAGLAEDEDLVPGRVEVAGDPILDSGQQSDHADRGGGVDGAGGALIVERDVSAGDRSAERAAGIRNAPGSLAELEEHLGLFRVAEVQAIGDAQRAWRRCRPRCGPPRPPPPCLPRRDPAQPAGQLQSTDMARPKPVPGHPDDAGVGARAAARWRPARSSRTARRPSACSRCWDGRAAAPAHPR